MKPVQIRRATIHDAEYISLLARFTFTETFGHNFRDHKDLTDYYDRTFSVSKIRSGLLNDNNIFILLYVMNYLLDMQNLKKIEVRIY